MTKEKPDEKNMHSGHRQRVLNSYSQIPLEALSPHQVLEYILFFIFPRGDVNPLAHRLLAKFGSVQNVIDAPPSELSKVYGISEHSAYMLNGFTKIFNYYTGSKLARKYLFKVPNDIYDYCEELMRYFDEEVLFAIAVDASYHVIAKRKLGLCDVNLVAVDPHEVLSFISEVKPASLVFVHNHPGDSCQATLNDLDGNKVLKRLLAVMRVQLIDHLVVGANGIYSMDKGEIVREFIDVEVEENDEVKEEESNPQEDKLQSLQKNLK